MSASFAHGKTLALLIAGALALPWHLASAQEPTPTQGLSKPLPTASTPSAEAEPDAKESKTFSTEQIEQIVAPIALHPDPLLSQILMASTYPLEIVQASRFMSANPKLTGKELDAKLKEQDWDQAVKSLCTMPEVLKQMNDNLDWTQDLGDAFLGQRVEVMDAVQRMRGKAYDAGNLKTTEHQVVTQQPDKIIVIQQANPEVVYVPSYSPTVVYGPAWTYPAPYYPAMYVPPPYGYGFVAFGAGVAVGAALYGGCNWGWGNSEVDIDINENTNFNRNTNANFDRDQAAANRDQRQADRGERSGERGDRRGERTADRGREGGRGSEARGGGGKEKWNHDPSHRKGVNYRDQKTASKFGAEGGQNRVSRDQARGYDRSQGRSSGAARSRDVASPSRSGAARSRGGSDAGRASRGGGREGAFGGSRNSGGLERSASARGDRSRGSSRASSGSSRGGSRASSGGSRGGMSRGGGGGGRGGGGRGGGGGRRR